ncbi:MAG: hypothetical protein ACI9XO_001664 [Paraglaciecola sp.]|jgi:hypothetical protein
MKTKYLTFLLFLSIKSFAQFAPPAGQIGTTAIAADSSIFVAWATGIELERGWQYIADESLGLAAVGEPEFGLGMANSPEVVSLGDGGIATLTFGKPIRNGEGFDFAVFENSFDGIFLELAFVEVSSDGENFVRFPATSETQSDEDIGSFGWIDAIKINNFAGKYEALFGTPFDLEELADELDLDIDKITHIRLIDVVGSTDEDYATYDQNDNAVNDPFPTPFPSSGFDLDAIGVIYENDLDFIENTDNQGFAINIFPNPVQNGQFLQVEMNADFNNKIGLALFDVFGKQLNVEFKNNAFYIENVAAGIYFIKGNINGKVVSKRVIISKF